MRSCLDNLKVGDVVWTCATPLFPESRYQILKIDKDLLTTLNQITNRFVFVGRDNFFRHSVIKILKSKC